MMLLQHLLLLPLLVYSHPMDPQLSVDPQHPLQSPGRPRRQTSWQEPETKQSEREGREHWLEEGRRELREALALSPNTGLARNVVLVVGDGMSLTTVAGARILKGQMAGRDGASSSLAWEAFPHLGLAKTYNVNSMVPDSAATAFAMYSGVKTNFFTMGFDSSIVLGSAESMVTSRPLETVLDWAQAAGMSSGLVTTARVTHATPAALYAKTAQRQWECDKLMPTDSPEQAWDISRQLVSGPHGRGLSVVLGGGLGSFLPDNYSRPGLATYQPTGWKWQCDGRGDGRDLVKEWEAGHPRGKVVHTRDQLLDLDTESTDQVLGLFASSYLPYEDERPEHPSTPSLTEMTTAALKVLEAKAGDRGFFLLVEAARIDMANHDGQAARALSETVEMDRAVQAVLAAVNTSETLVIVTADHSHTLSLGGYPGRRADVTGVSVGDNGWVFRAEDSSPLPILAYGNGPGFHRLQVRESLPVPGEEGSDEPGEAWREIHRSGSLQEGEGGRPTHVYPGAVPLERETHGGDDVGVWAVGPWSHLVHGVHEQSYLGHLMAHAACVGPGARQECRDRN